MNRIIIGTWGLSGDFGNVYPSSVEEVLRYADSKGIREFDTAPSYGNGFIEFCLGKVFYGRKDIVINTKVGNLPFYGKEHKLSALKSSIGESVRRLNGLPINTLFLHNPRYLAETLLDYSKELKDSGTIKSIGLSKAKNYEYPLDFIERFDVIQDDLNLLCLEPLQYIDKIPKFMARSVLASGLLANSYRLYDSDDIRSEWLIGERLASLERRVNIIKTIVNGDIASLARRFVFSTESVYKIIFGVRGTNHIDDIILDSQKPPLSCALVDTLVHLATKDFYLKNEDKYKY
jgi:aryl-alcohol dehydrogenase-like predicted oxidoreductase